MKGTVASPLSAFSISLSLDYPTQQAKPPVLTGSQRRDQLHEARGRVPLSGGRGGKLSLETAVKETA